MKKLFILSLVLFILTGCPQPGDDNGGGTEDTTPPTVLSIVPAADAVDIDPAADITVTFSEPIADATITSDNVVLSDTGTPVACSLDLAGAVLTINPDASLDSETTYDLSISVAVTDLAGNPLGAVYTSSFTTAPEVSISITSPASQYYTAVPNIVYTVTDGSNISVSLNGTAWSGGNNVSLSDTVTGLNTLTVTAEDVLGTEVSQTVTFFLNDLNVSATDDFNRADETTITGWDRFTPTPTATLSVSGNQLIGTDSNNTGANDIIWADYDPATDDECLMAVDIVELAPNEDNILFLIYWATGGTPTDDWDHLQLIFLPSYSDGVFTNYLLTMSEFDYSTTIAMDEAALSADFSLSSAATMMFYRNGNNYQGIVVNSDDSLAAYVRADNFTRNKDVTLTKRGLQYMCGDDSNDGDVLMKADNFIYYK